MGIFDGYQFGVNDGGWLGQALRINPNLLNQAVVPPATFPPGPKLDGDAMTFNDVIGGQGTARPMLWDEAGFASAYPPPKTLTDVFRKWLYLPPRSAVTDEPQQNPPNASDAKFASELRSTAGWDEAGFTIPGALTFAQPAPSATTPALPPGIRPNQIASLPPAAVSDAKLPAAATPTTGPTPNAPEPSFLDNLGKYLNNNSNTLMMLGAGIAGGRNWGEGISMGLTGAVKGRAADKTASNQLVMAGAVQQALVQRGMAPAQAAAIAQAAAADPKIAEKLLPQALGLNPPATAEAWLAGQLQKASETGQNVDPKALLQQYFNFVQGKSAAEKTGTVVGERQTNAQLDLPSAVAQAEENLRQVQQLRNHPGRNQIGWHDPLGSAPLIPGTKGYDASTLLDSIKGGAFLEAYKTLRGGGQITEVEGKKATDAIARMSRAQTRAEFDKALTDYEGVIRLGIDRANQQAGQKPPFEFRGNAVKPGTYNWTPDGGLKAQ